MDDDTSFQDFSANLSTENHGQVILQRLEEQRATKLCDVVVQSSDRRKYPCHKAILAANSSLLRDKVMKSSKIQTDIAADVLEPILDYFYTGTVRIDEANCIELLDAAVSLMVTPLEGAISHYIKRIAQENLRHFIESPVLLKVPPNLMKNAVGEVLIASSSAKRAMLLQVVEALANWAAADHVTRWEVYRGLLERVRNDKNPTRQVSCPITPLSSPSISSCASLHSVVSPTRSAPLPPPSGESANVMHSTPLGICRTKNMVLPTPGVGVEDQNDVYVELELSKGQHQATKSEILASDPAELVWIAANNKHDYDINNNNNNDNNLIHKNNDHNNPQHYSSDNNINIVHRYGDGVLDGAKCSPKAASNETTLSQLERQVKEVIEELKSKQLSDDEDIKL